ncbi:MAG: hypothetical protein APR62_10305 [Smithella sp. SDB]|nr:MAG: hypothetical protein APR62_10305 [Smithella sp. SDB]
MSKQNNPLISVIIPVYNISKYLERCVNSIIKQSYKNLEIMLVDDGSTDNSGEICDIYKEKDKRIRVIHKINGGLSSARNAGLFVIKGEYVGFVDGDDFIDEYMYETLLKAMLDNDADVVQTGYHHADEHGRIADTRTFREAKYNNLADMFYAFFEEQNIHVGVWSKLYKSKIFRNVRFLEGHVFEDYAILPNILNECEKCIVINGAFYNYAHNPESISRNKVSLNVINSRFAVPMYVLESIENIDIKYIGYAYNYICISSIRGYNKIKETDKINRKTKEECVNKLIDQYKNYFKLYREDAFFKRQKLFKKIKLYVFLINPYFSRLIFYVSKHFMRKLKGRINSIIRYAFY